VKSEEVDEATARIKSEFIARGNLRYDLIDELATALKSALADTERIDWLERNSQFSTACDVGPYIQINSPIAKSLREIIDERRKA